MPTRSLRKLGIVLGTALLAAVLLACLPDNPYQRFASLEHTIQNRIRWIYERSRFDPAPIDIAVIGSSRTGAGVSAPTLEADLRRLGAPLTSVNFSLPENGRDLNWVVLDQLLRAKHPRLLVIGVIEKPGRYGHPAFKYVAPAAAVVDPAYFGNLSYIGNLIYLPYRQARLFAATLFPGFFGLPARFDPSRYTRGEDTTVTFTAGDGKVVERNARVSRAVLLAGVAKYERGVSPPVLGPRFADIEFGNERIYLARMVALARAHHVRVAFLFLPYFHGPHVVQERAFYARYGPLLDASFLSDHDEWYSDVAHLNHAGAVVLTNWLAPRVAALAGAPVHQP